MNGERVILAAHRGDRVAHPENTMPAFVSALEFGCDMIETDIRMTKDGELVLIHDRSTLRTSGVDKNVDELTLDKLREINVGATFGDGKTFVPVPTVREFAELIKDTEMLVNWELKVYPKDFGDEVAFAIVDKLMGIIFEYGLESRSMLNSFSDRVIEYAHLRYGGKFPIHGQGISLCQRSNDEPDTMSREDLYDWCCLYPNEKGTGKIALDFPDNFAYCVERGIIPCICIKDEVENYRRAIELGCRMFTTNDIYACDRILRELGVR
jgi:glycerophosphoryl diester phosphodiesterase